MLARLLRALLHLRRQLGNLTTPLTSLHTIPNHLLTYRTRSIKMPAPTMSTSEPAPAAAPQVQSEPASESPAAPAPTTNAPTAISSASATPTNPALPPGNTPNPLSKNAQKKAAKLAKFAATREAWKATKKEKNKAKKAVKNALKRAASPDPTVPKRQKTAAVPREVVDITLIMDLGFDELMTDKEVASMSSQLTRCYSANKSAQKQFKFCCAGLDGRLKERYETVIGNQHKNWRGVDWVEGGYVVEEKDKTPEGDLVYLTADSEDTITELEEGKKYIIGGIVDRNRHKGLCYNKAKEQGIKTGKLPIGDYIKMASRQVLTTNQVVEIMLSWLETRDWEQAFVKTIPQRKMAELKKGKKEDGDEEEEEEEGEEEHEEEAVKKEEATDDAAEEQLQAEAKEASLEPVKSEDTQMQDASVTSKV